MSILSPANLVAWAVQAFVVVLVAAPLPRLVGLWSPRARMIYWRVVLVGCLLLPLLQPWQVLPAAVSQPVPPPGPGAAVEVLVQAPGVVAAPAQASPGVLEAAWGWLRGVGLGRVIVAGIVLRLAWLGLGLLTVARLRRAATRLWPRPESVDRAADLAETDAEFLVSPTSSRPVTCGVIWPVVLVPRNFESFPVAEQTAIACHELLHVGRADWVRNAADELLRAVTWFHPGIWWLINQIQLAREQVVDREAVRRLGSRQPYLEALLRLATPAPRLILTPASAFLKRAHLRERVTLLVKEVSMSRARLVASFAIMAVVLFAGGRIVTSAVPLQQQGAPAPGVQAAAPKLPAGPITIKFAEGITARQVMKFITDAGGLTVTYEPGTDRSLETVVGPIEMKDTTLTTAITLVLDRAHLGFKVVGERALVVTANYRGVVGGVAGSPYTPGGGQGSSRPGVAAGTGSGVGSGTGAGVQGGVKGGVAGGVGSAVPGGVTGGIVGGMPGGVQGGVQGGIVGGVPGGVQGGIVGGVPVPPPPHPVTSSPLNVVTRVDPNAPGVTGRVVVGVLVGADGAVTMAGRQDPPGTPVVVAAGDAAVDAARQWVFEPGTADRPVLMGFNLTPLNTSGLVNPAVVRIGGDIKAPRKVVDVKPIYPAEAQASRQQGVQILEISVAPTGEVLDARSLRGALLLVRSAIDAVLQWKFEEWPGAERRLMTVTVNFVLDGGPGGVTGAAPAVTTPPPPPANWPTNAIRVGGDIKPPMKVRDVKPVYPKEAQDARVQGVTIIEVVIGPDGKVMDARVLRSIPMLDAAALEAVRQWEFTPTLLNGNPVPVIMTVTVNFTLM